jgi:hypothetical protein
MTKTASRKQAFEAFLLQKRTEWEEAKVNLGLEEARKIHTELLDLKTAFLLEFHPDWLNCAVPVEG